MTDQVTFTNYNPRSRDIMGNFPNERDQLADHAEYVKYLQAHPRTTTATIKAPSTVTVPGDLITNDAGNPVMGSNGKQARSAARTLPVNGVQATYSQSGKVLSISSTPGVSYDPSTRQYTYPNGTQSTVGPATREAYDPNGYKTAMTPPADVGQREPSGKPIASGKSGKSGSTGSASKPVGTSTPSGTPAGTPPANPNVPVKALYGEMASQHAVALLDKYKNTAGFDVMNDEQKYKLLSDGDKMALRKNYQTDLARAKEERMAKDKVKRDKQRAVRAVARARVNQQLNQMGEF